MIKEIFLITVIIACIYSTGFFEDIDRMINSKYPLYHLPKIIMCQNCATWWCCVLFCIITNNLTLASILVCILMWHLSPIVSNVLEMITATINNFFVYLDKKINSIWK